MSRSMTLVEWKRAMARLAAIRNYMVVTSRVDLYARSEEAKRSLETDRDPEAAAKLLSAIAEQLEPYSDLQDAIVLLSIWLKDYPTVEGSMRTASLSELSDAASLRSPSL